MKILNGKRSAALLIVVFAVIFAGFNGVFDRLITNLQLDLTENSRFTLSDGTRTIVSSLKQPVTLRFFYSRKIAANYPQTRAYADRVRDLLHRYEEISHGKVQLIEIDPEPYTPQEDEANEAGLTPVPTDSGDNVYFGLTATTKNGQTGQIAYFSASREPSLEYDITAMLDRLTNPRPKIAVVSGLPLEGGAQRPPLTLYAELNQNFDVDMLPAGFTAIPKTDKALLLLHPTHLSEAQLYAIDQYALSGGHIAVFVDPDSNLAGDASGMNPYAIPSVSSSNLAPLFKAWGIGFNPKKEVADLELAQKVQVNRNGAPAVALYPAWLHITGDSISGADPVTASLQELNLGTAGAITPLKGATTKMLPLIRTSARASLLDVAMVHGNQDPEAISAAVQPSGTRYILAARVTGNAKTAFPNGAPVTAPQADSTDKAQKSPVPPLAAGKINVVVVADTDLINDQFWVHSNPYSGGESTPFADNGALVLNIAGNLAGSDALASLRTRKPSDRPFTLVQQLQADAAVQYQQQAQTLQAQLKDTKAQLEALLAKSGKTASKQDAAQQQIEISKFRQKLLETRSALRAVEHNLRLDINVLGDILAVFNIAFIPALVIVFALLLGWRRRRRQVRLAKAAQPRNKNSETI